MEPDELSALKLDEEFKNNLALIRPHVLSINSLNEAHMVRLWLDKLSQCLTGDRVIRNAYLAELRHQVEQGWLQTPFCDPPPSTPLLPLSNIIKQPQRNLAKVNDNSSSWSDISEGSSIQTCPSPDMIYHKGREKFPIMYELPYEMNGRIGNYFQENWQFGSQSCSNKAMFKPAVNYLFTGQQGYAPVPLDSTFQKNDEHYIKTVNSLKAVIKDLQKQNDMLTKEMVHCQQSASIGNANVESDIKTLAKDIATLKSKLEELQKIKEALESSHKEMVTQYQKDVNATMTNLSLRLQEAQSKNQYLEKSVDGVMHRLNSLEIHQDNKWRKLVLKEAAVFHSKLSELRSIHNNKVTELESNVDSLNKELHERNTEVLRLESLLKQQCAKMQEEVLDIHKGIEESSKTAHIQLQAKVKHLKRCVLKHQKFSRKITYYYEKKLLELQEKMQSEVKDLHLQMKTKEALLSTVMSDEKQKDLDELVSKLEERYRQLLADVEAEATKKSHKYQKRITELEIQLALLQVSKIKPTHTNTSVHSV